MSKKTKSPAKNKEEKKEILRRGSVNWCGKSSLSKMVFGYPEQGCQGRLAFPLPMTVPGAKLQSPPCDRRTHRLLHTDNIDNAVLDTCRIAFLLHFLCLHCSVHDVVHAFTPLGASWRVRERRPGRGGHALLATQRAARRARKLRGTQFSRQCLAGQVTLYYATCGWVNTLADVRAK